jgi:hypothetical protein
MGWLGSVGRFVAKEHGHILGWGWVRSGARLTQRQWMQLCRPLCPKCGEGHLFPETIAEGGVTRKFLGCSNEACDHYEAAGRHKDDETIKRLRTMAQARFSDPSERAAKIRQFRFQSRLQYVMAGVCLAIAIWLFIRSPAQPVYLNVAVIGIFLISKALRASYRCWQVEHNRLFEAGLFRIWFNSGKWFV